MIANFKHITGKKTVLLLAEDNKGHAGLIRMNLKRSSFRKTIIHFLDGQEILNFFYMKGKKPHRERDVFYILLLDIRMPKVDGIEVLRQIKQDVNLNQMPVIMTTTTENPETMEECYDLGCDQYIVKPVDYNEFAKTFQELGTYIKQF